ncbi:MAG: DUF4388 domain-containing protein [Acidobacteriota bacterium]
MSESSGALRVHAEAAGNASELEGYLNDTLAPLQVADSVIAFLEHEPEGASRAILRWADQQLNANLHSIPISEFLYHALRKIHLFQDLGLADADRVRVLLRTATRQVRTFCPSDELADFDANLARLDEESRMTKAVEFLHRAGTEPDEESLEDRDDSEEASEPPKLALRREGDAGPVDAAASDADEAVAQADAHSPEPPPRPERARDLNAVRNEQVALGLRRFSMLVETLEQATERLEDSDEKPLVTHLLSSAAVGAKNYDEFREYLDRLKSLGLQDLHLEQLVRSVAETLPDWYLEGDGSAQPHTAASVAIERIVDLSEDEAAKTSRLHEIVTTAVEHFNQRRLGSALTLFELVEGLLKSGEFSPEVQRRILETGRPSLQMAPFRERVGDPELHPQLRRVLGFYPDLRVEGLVRRLLNEQNRRTRHLIMDLLRIHGSEARDAVTELLISSTSLSGREWPWFFVRNLIRLLREIPVVGVAVSDFELDTVVGYADPKHATQVVREAVTYLGSVPHPRAAAALSGLFHSYREASVGLREGAGSDMAKIQSLALTSMLRVDNPQVRAAALNAILFDSRRREENVQLVTVLGTVDLSADRGTLDLLLRSIRLRLPREGLTGTVHALRMQLPKTGWMGRMRRPGSLREAALRSLIQSLAGTPTAEVTGLLSEIEELAPSEQLALAARKTRIQLEEKSFETVGGSEATLSGDLEVFGLPNLLQSLNYSETSGMLFIEAEERDAAVRLQHGRFVDAKVGDVRGVEALYLLLERPLPSRFRFVANDGQQPVKNPQELKAVLFEAMRRRDEFERLRLLVPDEALLSVSGDQKALSLPVEQQDADFAKRLWDLLRESPKTSLELESYDLGDPYSVRRLLAFWIESERLDRIDPASEARRVGE